MSYKKDIKYDWEKIEKNSLFFTTRVRKTNLKSVVIGLSGGLDSAVTTILCKKAYGKSNLNIRILPTKYSNKQNIKDAKIYVKKIV